MPANAAAKKPPQVSFTDAATLGVAAATAYDGVTQLKLNEGQTLLINGVGGGVGVAAAQIARDLNINVIGTASEDKRELIESLGATLVPYGDGVADRIRQLLPDGVDAIFDLAGGDGLRAVADLVADREKLISAGDFETTPSSAGTWSSVTAPRACSTSWGNWSPTASWIPTSRTFVPSTMQRTRSRQWRSDTPRARS